MFLQISKPWTMKTSKCEEKKHGTFTVYSDAFWWFTGKDFCQRKGRWGIFRTSLVHIFVTSRAPHWLASCHRCRLSTAHTQLLYLQHICQNRKTYFSKSQNGFLQIAKCMSPNCNTSICHFLKCICPPTGTVWQIYCSPWHNIQLESLHSWTPDWRADTAKL